MKSLASNTGSATVRTLIRMAALGALALPAAANAQVLSFSHDDFSGVQGQHGWYYGFFDGSSATPWRLNDFEQLPIWDGAVWRRQDGPGGYWTDVTRDGGHPNGTITSGGRTPEVNWSVRRWVSDRSAVVNVFGRVWDSNPSVNSVGNGVTGYVMVDGATIWQANVDAGNQHGVEYSLTFCIVPGSIVDFAIDPRDGNDLADDTGFHATVRTIIDHQPQNTLTCNGGTADFEIVTIPGDYTYQWRHEGVPIMHDGNMPTYRVTFANAAKAGRYDCVVTNDCGSMVSDPAYLRICDADYDCDGFIDSQDYFTFLGDFFENAARSDINHNGFIDSQDFFDFTVLFFTGCRD